MQNYKLAKEMKAVQKQEGCDLQLTQNSWVEWESC